MIIVAFVIPLIKISPSKSMLEKVKQKRYEIDDVTGVSVVCW